MPPLISETPVQGLGHAIQLALAPVFVLTGVGSLLGVLTNRLARIVDRMRRLEENPPAGLDPAAARAEIASLRLRAVNINRAISLCTYCALLIAAVVAALFLGRFVETDFSKVVAGMFILAMLALIAGLLMFLREVHTAIRFMRSTPRRDGDP